MALAKEQQQLREASQQQRSANSLQESPQRMSTIPTSPQRSSQSLKHHDMSPRTVVNHKTPQRKTGLQEGTQRTLVHHESTQRQPTSQHMNHQTTKIQSKPLEHYPHQMHSKSSSYMSDDGHHSPINNQRSSWMTGDEPKRQQLLQSGHSRSSVIPISPSR